MSRRSKAVLWALFLAILTGALIWHVIGWQCGGMYQKLYDWIQEGRGYLTVLYNIGLMLAGGLVLGLLMERLIEALDIETGNSQTHGQNEKGKREKPR